MSAAPKYISATETAQLVREAKVNEVQVVDVRDDDVAGGNIVGAVNQPSRTFHDNVEKLARAHKDVPKMIFHCALSKERGPKMARIYSETQKRLFPESTQEVLVLRDGFTGFQQQYRDDPKLVEKFDKMYHD